MRALLRHPFRVIGRLLWMCLELLLGAFGFLFRCAFRWDRCALPARAEWLQSMCRRFLRIFSAEVVVSGPVPARGVLVSNHLSYVDILVFASLTPAVFVAKHEVKSWPVFGWFARLAGTLFVDRERRTHVGETAGQIKSALDRGALVILFPEGTSSDGETVLPFKSSLLEPAIRAPALSAALIRYELDEGDVREEVCYWKDMTLMPHLVNLFSKRRFRASVRFTEVRAASDDRKELARQLHSEVMRLREAAP